MYYYYYYYCLYVLLNSKHDVSAACMDCLGRTPYASLSATILMCLGVGLFCGTGFYALDITRNGIFDNLFKFHVEWSVLFICLIVSNKFSNNCNSNNQTVFWQRLQSMLHCHLKPPRGYGSVTYCQSCCINHCFSVCHFTYLFLNTCSPS